MKYRITFSPEATDQLIEIEAYIAKAASEIVASKYIDAVIEHCLSLDQFPEGGTSRDDIRPGVRLTNYKKRTVIAYCVEENSTEVLILGVFYGGRDYETILKEDF